MEDGKSTQLCNVVMRVVLVKEGLRTNMLKFVIVAVAYSRTLNSLGYDLDVDSYFLT